MRSIVFFILVVGIHITTISYAADSKVFTDSDLKNYTSEADERNRAYNYSVIQIDRASKEVRAKREFKEEVRRNVEKSKAELADKIAEAEERNSKKKQQKQKERVSEYIPPTAPPPVIINVPPPPPVPGPAVIISPSGKVSTGIVIPY